MSQYEVEVQTGDGEKGRSFKGTVLACASADGLWELGAAAGDTWRPVMLTLACDAGAARPMLENLRGGRKARLRGASNNHDKGSPLELCKSAGYRFTQQQAAGQVVITAHLPELFDFMPGIVDPAQIRIVLMPAVMDVDSAFAPEDIYAVTRHLRLLGREIAAVEVEANPRLVGIAVMASRYLGQRCEYPMPPGAAFSSQLYFALRDRSTPALTQPLDFSKYARAHGVGSATRNEIAFRIHVAAGLAMMPGIAIRTDGEALSAILSEETLLFERAKRGETVSKRRPRAKSRMEARVL